MAHVSFLGREQFLSDVTSQGKIMNIDSEVNASSSYFVKYDTRELSDRLSKKPILVFWETTKACPLSCKHCRAEAVSTGLPGELTNDEGKNLISQIRNFGSPAPILVLTGGDVMMRQDLLELVSFANQTGVRVALSPAVSDLLSEEMMNVLYDLGVRSVSISLDGIGDTHDQVRGTQGHFAKTTDMIARLIEIGFSVQVNTTVMSTTVNQLPAVAEYLLALGVKIWEVFFLIRVGRGTDLLELSPFENEDVARFLYEVSGYGLLVRTVEAPFSRRVVFNLQHCDDGPGELLPEGDLYRSLSADLIERLGQPTARRLSPIGSTRDGKGIVFVAHDGTVFPSGFLPLGLGNVKSESLVDIYRENPLLQSIRNAEFSGRCGKCRYRDLCGGSRARAFSFYGDPLAEDPACGFVA